MGLQSRADFPKQLVFPCPRGFGWSLCTEGEWFPLGIANPRGHGHFSMGLQNAPRTCLREGFAIAVLGCVVWLCPCYRREAALHASVHSKCCRKRLTPRASFHELETPSASASRLGSGFCGTTCCAWWHDRLPLRGEAVHVQCADADKHANGHSNRLFTG